MTNTQFDQQIAELVLAAFIDQGVAADLIQQQMCIPQARQPNAEDKVTVDVMIR